MWYTIKKIGLVKKFLKPSVKAWLLPGQQVRVDFTNTSAEEAVLVSYAIVQQLAAHLKMDKRALLNKMLKMDANVAKVRKMEARALKYGKKN